MSDFELPESKKIVRRPQPSAQALSKARAVAPISDDEINSKIRSEEQAVMASPEPEVDEEPKKEKPKFDEEELLNIFDDMVFNGYYEEKMSLKGGRLQVGFRTRTADEYSAINDSIDATKANLIATIVDKRQLLNLHYALTKYQGQNIGALKHEEKVKFINGLASPMIGVLIMALGKFDEKIQEACRFGEEDQNF